MDDRELAALFAGYGYQPNQLFTKDGDTISWTIWKPLSLPQIKLWVNEERSMKKFRPLKEVKWKDFGVKKGSQESSMRVGKLLNKYLIENPKSLPRFSPDELVSNKSDAVFNSTGRNFQWDQYSSTQGGRVIETLSEHQCQGFLQGYTLTGRVRLFLSYESFLSIIHTMMVQYSEFNKMVRF
jgi:xylulose-5-phosphate/fructose-6-phosphate phosphoketolase